MKKLGVKISVVFVVFTVLLGVFVSVFTYMMSTKIATAFYSEKGEELSKYAAGLVDGDRIGSYLKTMETDGYYDELHEKLGVLKADMDVEYLYIFEPGEDRLTFIMEAQTPEDDPELISPMGSTYDYTELEYTHLVPSIMEERPSEGVILSTQELFFGSAVSTWHPIFDSDGVLVAFVEADFSLDAVMGSIRSNLITMLSVYVVAIIVMVTLLSVLMRVMVSVPLSKLTARTLKFAAEGKLQSFENDIKTGDEMQTLSEAFGKMATDIDSYTRTQESVVADRERISTELQVASQMQTSMLPRELPDFINRHTFDIAGSIKPCRGMGGDFYDYYIIEDRWVCAVICDVQAIGITAAMVLIVAKTIIKSQLQTGDELSAAMNAVNKQIYEATNGEVPVNTFVGVLDTLDGSFDYVNAGYNAPLLLRQGGRYEFISSTAYAPLGVNENVSYLELKLTLHQGERMVLFSNGFVEAKNRDGESFGAERTRTALNAGRARNLGLGALLGNLRSEMEVFTDGTEPDGDVTLLAIEYRKGDKELAKLSVPARPESAGALTAFLREQMKENNVTGKYYAQLTVLAEELFTLCCRYTERGAEMTVSCEVPAGTRRVILSFAAAMNGKNLLADETESTANAIAFVRRTADDISFSNMENVDTLTVSKTVT